MDSGGDRPTPTSESADDLAWCHETVESVSRTFAISIDLLDEPMSSSICVGYLVCRVADTVEDARELSPAEKARLLDAYDAVLDPEADVDAGAFVDAVEDTTAVADTDDWRLVAESERVIRAFEALPQPDREAIRAPARELVQGMATFVRRHADRDGIRVQTADELEEYCYYVAGVVGTLITNLERVDGGFDTPPERMYECAEGFGHLLQLVNIAKDVHADYTEEANVYLPASWLAEEGVDQEDVLRPEHRADVARVVERTADLARTYLDDAQAWLEGLSIDEGTMLVAWTVPYLLAVGTLRELSARPEDALTEEGVKLSRQEVMAIVAGVTTDFDREALGPLREAVRRGDLC